jgi:hypothetical protein
MNDDALAAVVAAAHLLLASADSDDSTPAACWTIAGRMRKLDADGTRRVARFRSRWAMMGRLQ